MEENFYRAPTAVVADLEIEAPKFYVVSTLKFWVMMITTLGIYRVYWSYKHWALYKAKTGQSMWPVMRAIFSIFG